MRKSFFSRWQHLFGAKHEVEALLRKTQEMLAIQPEQVDEIELSEEAHRTRAYYEHLFRRQGLIEVESRTFHSW